jgi:phospholipid/cholesterol/gamma-HCH transport system substrate-binding protein
MFTEAGGLDTGNDVTVSGIKVGSVSSIELVNGDALVGFTIEGKYALGSDSTAHIRTGTLLGERVLALESAGSGTLDRRQTIPTTRTSSPYSLTDAVSELTANTAGTDTDALNQSLDTLSQTLDQIAPQLGPTFDGVSRLSRSLNNRNESLTELLKTAGDVTEIFSERSQQVNSLILNSNDLLAVLNDRRYAITSLLASTSAVSRELTGVVADNEAELAPTLERLNSVTAMLEKNRDNLAKMLPGAAKYYLTQGEIVSNGAYYNALVPNLVFGQLLQPFLDYAFGFRRGIDAGQPPDTAGPRAELPFPVNSIPQPGDLPNDGDPGEPQP